MDKRFKLSQAQFEEIVAAQNAVDGAMAAYQAALRQANAVGRLINDFHGLAEGSTPAVDPKTRELVVPLPDPPPSPDGAKP